MMAKIGAFGGGIGAMARERSPQKFGVAAMAELFFAPPNCYKNLMSLELEKFGFLPVKLFKLSKFPRKSLSGSLKVFPQ